MSKKQIAEQSGKDTLKWGGVLLLWILSFAAYYFFTTIPDALKAIGWIAVLVTSVVVLMTTARGKAIVSFIKEGRVELQKVVWPTRKEAGQITMIVILVVFLAGIFLWSVDSGVMWLIGKLTQLV